MDLERITTISIDDDSTMHSTQDRPSEQGHHYQGILSNHHKKKKKKIRESLDDFDSDEDNDVDNKIYKKKCGNLRTNERSILLL